MSREYPPRPILAVVVAVINNKNQILLVKRRNEPYRGMLSVPGGVVEIGEKLVEAAKRETKEETNIDIRIEDFIDYHEIIIKDKKDKIRWHYVIMMFKGIPIGGVLQASSDASEAMWININDALEMNITNYTRHLIGKIINTNKQAKKL